MIRLNSTNNTSWSWTTSVPCQAYNPDSNLFTYTYNPSTPNLNCESINVDSFIGSIKQQAENQNNDIKTLKERIECLEYMMEGLQRKIEALTEAMLFDK